VNLVRSDVAGSVVSGESMHRRRRGRQPVRQPQEVLVTQTTEPQVVIITETILDGDGVVIYGNAVYGDAFSTPPSSRTAVLHHDHPIDFPAANEALLSLCRNIHDLETNGEVVFEADTIHLIGTDPVSNVFQLAAEDLQDGIGIQFSIPLGATAVVRGTGTGTVRGMKPTSGPPQTVL
jgi:choice-of-anchor A domain-containing protein